MNTVAAISSQVHDLKQPKGPPFAIGADQFLTAGGTEVRIAGKTIAEIVDIAGGTPCYVYSRDSMAARIRTLRSELPASLKLLYSIKANPHPLVVSAIGGQVDGFDVTSQKELRLALGASANPTIQFSGPGKSLSDIRVALAADALLNIESARQFDQALAVARAQNKTPRICIRVNPSFLPGGAGLRMTGKPSQFGIFEKDIPELLSRMKTEGVAPVGFHFYWGTQMLNGQTIADIQLAIWSMASSWIEAFGLPICHLNLGGGIGIPYHTGEKEADLAPVCAALDRITCDFTAYTPQGKVCLELGRYIVGPSGIYLTSVLDSKAYQDETFVVTDGGLHHNLSATGNFGQGLHRAFPCFVPGKLDRRDLETVSLVGCLCTPMDVFARRIELPPLDVGDVIGILQTGAYGLSASPNGFLSHEPANEVVL